MSSALVLMIGFVSNRSVKRRIRAQFAFYDRLAQRKKEQKTTLLRTIEARCAVGLNQHNLIDKKKKESD